MMIYTNEWTDEKLTLIDELMFTKNTDVDL